MEKTSLSILQPKSEEEIKEDYDNLSELEQVTFKIRHELKNMSSFAIECLSEEKIEEWIKSFETENIKVDVNLECLDGHDSQIHLIVNTYDTNDYKGFILTRAL